MQQTLHSSWHRGKIGIPPSYIVGIMAGNTIGPVTLLCPENSVHGVIPVKARFNLALLHVIHLKLLQERLGGAPNARARRLHLRAATRNERLSPVEVVGEALIAHHRCCAESMRRTGWHLLRPEEPRALSHEAISAMQYEADSQRASPHSFSTLLRERLLVFLSFQLQKGIF